MKKITIAVKERQCRIARYRLEERLRRRGRRRRSKECCTWASERMRAPITFNLTMGAGREVVLFLSAVARRVLEQKKPVRLDFRETERLYVPGTILLYSELDRIISLSELSKPITILDPYQRRPREVLKQIGLHNLTGDTCDVVPERKDVVYWKATKGQTQSGESYGSLVEAIAEKANREHAKQLEVSGLWRGVNEAVANSIDHAYKKPRWDGFQGLDTTKWWMFSQIKDGIFTLAVCDLGCGYRATINETLPELFIAQVATRLLRKNRDALAIDTAMEYGRSGTHQGNRGKGSRDVLSLLAKHGDGELVVMSNTGLMRYEYSGGEEISRKEIGLGCNIGGTIVWWKLPLRELSGDQRECG